MKRILVLAVLFLLVGRIASADYTTHQIVGNDGKIITVAFNGVGEAEARLTYTVSQSSTFVGFRTWVGQQFLNLNASVAVSKLAAVQVGQTVVPIDPTVLTAVEIAANAWGAKIALLELNQNKLARFTALGVTPSGALQTAITALNTQIGTLRTEINADYNAADGPTRAAMNGKF